MNRLPDMGTPRCEVLSSPKQVREVLETSEHAERVALEVQTEGPGAVGATLAGVSLCFEPGAAYQAPLGLKDTNSDAILQELRPLLGADGPPKVMHDAKTGLIVLAQRAVDAGTPAFDTLLAAFLLDGKAHGLEDLIAERLGLSTRGRVAKGSEERTRNFCARADAVLRLGAILEAELEERGQLWYLRELELQLVPVLADMELAGVAVDAAALEEISHRLAEKLQDLEREMAEAVGHEVHPRSPRRLGELLYEELGLEGSRKTSSGRYSTDALTLEALAGQHPVVEKIAEHRRLSRLKDAYADTLPGLIDPQTGRVHTSFSQVSASSGRLVSREPNLQNIPVRTALGREIRKAFVADGSGFGIGEPTALLSADYSQIELRVLAHVTGERALREAFQKGDDVHTLAAARLYGVPPEEVSAEMRRVGKILNYGVIYGMTGYRLALEAGIDRKEATRFVKRHGEQYPAVRAYVERTLREAEEKGYVETPMGRRRYLPDLGSKNRQRREGARRAAENMPNQGMVAEIIKLAMIRVHERLREEGMASRMLLQVHDELLLEVPEGELAEVAGLVVREMRNAVELSVPLEVEVKIGRSWGEMRRLGGALVE
ncbi:MAG: polymerase [Rubrobacteraceae bacterium]|jgi:DNA polymerase-1|nr:polymerase [Rubrobacteraceae bacterium]